MPYWFPVACQIATIACAIVGGVFLTFSGFVMRALDRSNRAAGVETMQVINREVFRSAFMVLLIGMSALSPVLMTQSWFGVPACPSMFVLAGGGVYLAGVFAVTLAFNVPMNNRLDRLDHAAPEAAAYWAETYYPEWSFWNFVRAFSAVVASILYLLASLSLTTT